MNSEKIKDRVASKDVQNFLPIEDLPESSHRVRRNLIIFASLALFYRLSGVRFKSECSNILGFGFENIGEKSISVILFLIVLYHFVHFSWLAIEHAMHNYILLSRTSPKNHIPTGIGYTDLSEEWNLYIWWKKHFKNFDKQFQNAENKIRELLEFNQKKAEDSKADAWVKQIQQAESFLNGMNGTLIELRAIEKPLKRFDDKYKSYILTQKFRWIFLELGLPVLLGLFAILAFCSSSFKENLIVLGKFIFRFLF